MTILNNMEDSFQYWRLSYKAATGNDAPNTDAMRRSWCRKNGVNVPTDPPTTVSMLVEVGNKYE